MVRNALILTLLLGAIAAGCNCNGCNEVVIDERDAGGGGGGPDAGGELPDAGTFDAGESDAGDGTITGGVGPGGWNLDGGVNDAGVGGVGEGVQVNDAGYLELGGGEIQLHFAWIANASAGTVSKFDTKTGKEVGRYHAVVPRDGKGNTLPLSYTMGNSPSRTAVDLFGDVWVANRAPGTQGSVTKIANAITNCVDRNGNGQIETSRDLNGDGNIDVNSAEFIVPSDPNNPTQYDECILFSTLIGGAGGGVKGRALAIAQGIEGSGGDVWVGVHENKSVIKLKNATGEQIPVNSSGAMEIQLAGFGSGPYGMAVDGQQRLWVVDTLDGHLGLIDAKTGTLINDGLHPPPMSPPVNSYGIAIDGKDRVWLAGWNGPYATRYDHGPGLNATAGTWTRFDFSGTVCQNGLGLGRGRGIAADDTGFIWMSAYTNELGQGAAQLIAFNGDSGAIKPFNLSAGGTAQCIDASDGNTQNSIGVGLDSDGHPWVNNYSGNVMRVHRDTGDVLKTASQAGNLYTYSDFTGYQLRKFTAPRGSYTHTFAGCDAFTKWTRVEWDANTPSGTSVQVYIKVANSLGDLENMSIPRYGPFTVSPVDLEAAGVPTATYLRVEFVLTSDGQTSPVLKSFDVKWACTGTIG